MQQIRTQPWFHGSITRSLAEHRYGGLGVRSPRCSRHYRQRASLRCSCSGPVTLFYPRRAGPREPSTSRTLWDLFQECDMHTQRCRGREGGREGERARASWRSLLTHPPNHPVPSLAGAPINPPSIPPRGRLEDASDGTYLFRESETRPGFSLSLKVPGRVKHFMISKKESGTLPTHLSYRDSFAHGQSIFTRGPGGGNALGWWRANLRHCPTLHTGMSSFEFTLPLLYFTLLYTADGVDVHIVLRSTDLSFALHRSLVPCG